MTLPELPDLLIEEELGRGGMGVVYKGYQTLLDRYVAVKFLNVDNAEASVRDRFRREARVLASLSHPNIVACHSAGTDDGGRLYLIMEYVDGPSLQDYITKQGPLRPVVALALIQQIATALEYALTQGIIHRDIKPENILLKNLSQTSSQIIPGIPYLPKVVDLGLARFQSDLQQQATQLTAVGTVMGTPSTMAPEMFNNPDSVDFRVDIYGLGCVLYHMVTGRRPYAGRPLSQVMHSKFNEPPPSPLSVDPSLPKPVGDLVERFMAKDKSHRPASYSEVIEACQQTADACSALEAKSEQGVRWGGPWIALIAVGLIGVGVAGYVALVSSRNAERDMEADARRRERASLQASLPAPPALPAATATEMLGQSAFTEDIVVPSPPPPPTADVAILEPDGTILWDEDGSPLFEEDFLQRLALWEPPTGGASWGAGEEEGSVIGIGTGDLYFKLGGGDWFVQGALRSVSAREIGFGILMDGDRRVKLQLGDTGTNFLARLSDGETLGVPEVLDKEEQLPWRLEKRGRKVSLTAGGTMWEAPLSDDPTHLLLHVAGGAAVFLDLTLHRPIQ